MRRVGASERILDVALHALQASSKGRNVLNVNELPK